MKTTVKTLIIIKTILALIIFQACEKPQPIVETTNEFDNGEKKFDSELFKQNVIAGMGEEWAGYQMVINEKGLLAHEYYFGESVSGNDGHTDLGPGVPMYWGSVGKFITTVAILHALDKYQGGAISKLNTSIEPYLPDDWSIGQNVTGITFRELLLHQTGIPSNASTNYGSLKEVIKNGVPVESTYNYSNANFALLRIILPFITGEITSVSGLTDEQMQEKTLSVFKRYVKTQIFEPLAIQAQNEPSDIAPALYYKYQDLPNANGWAMGDMSASLGAGGWFMSAMNMAKFLAYLNETEDILSKETRAVLYGAFLGLSDLTLPTDSPSGEHGIYYTKGGSFQNNGRGTRGIIVIFPASHTEIALVANSRGGNMDNTGGIRQMIFKAYDDAWVIK